MVGQRSISPSSGKSAMGAYRVPGVDRFWASNSTEGDRLSSGMYRTFEDNVRIAATAYLCSRRKLEAVIYPFARG